MTLWGLNKLDTKTKQREKGKLQDSLSLKRRRGIPQELQQPEPAVERDKPKRGLPQGRTLRSTCKLYHYTIAYQHFKWGSPFDCLNECRRTEKERLKLSTHPWWQVLTGRNRSSPGKAAAHTKKQIHCAVKCRQRWHVQLLCMYR